MEVGRHLLSIRSPGYHESTRFVDVSAAGNPQAVKIILESMHKPKFVEFREMDAALQPILKRSAKVRSSVGAGKMLRGMSEMKKAAMLNILAKMKDVDVGTARHKTVLGHVDRVCEVYQDRIYVQLKKGSKLLNFLDDIVLRPDSGFSAAGTSLHKGFSDASFKTYEPTGTCSLQMSFDASDEEHVRVDADIDIYADKLRHFFGEVFRNHLTGVKTDPFDVYQRLMQNGIRPPYSLTGG